MFMNILLCIILHKLINIHMYNNHCNVIATANDNCNEVMHFLLLLLLYTRSMDINRRMKLYSIYKVLHRHICGEGKIS